MSTRTYDSAASAATTTWMWGGAATAGLLAGVGMGLIMHFVMNAMPLVGALYGQPSVAIGWLAHLFHSVVFALVFAAVVARTRVRDYGLPGLVGVGAAYGALLELVAAGAILPVWANAVGADPLPLPFLIPIGFVTHLVYGVLLGALFGFVWTSERAESTTSEQAERPAA